MVRNGLSCFRLHIVHLRLGTGDVLCLLASARSLGPLYMYLGVWALVGTERASGLCFVHCAQGEQGLCVRSVVDSLSNASRAVLLFELFLPRCSL